MTEQVADDTFGGEPSLTDKIKELQGIKAEVASIDAKIERRKARQVKLYAEIKELQDRRLAILKRHGL